MAGLTDKTGIYAEMLLWLKTVKKADGTAKWTLSQVNYLSTLQTAVASVLMWFHELTVAELSPPTR